MTLEKGITPSPVLPQYVFLTIPGKAYLLFAPAVLLGSLLGLGALASNSELTVMRAAGVSGGRIIRGSGDNGCRFDVADRRTGRDHHA